MGVNPLNIIAGPATLHVAPFGSTETADALAPLDAAWRDVGGTTGGVQFAINQSYMDLRVDQVAESVGKRVTDRTVRVTTTLAEATLLNLATAIAELDTAVVTVAGTSTLEPSGTDPAAEPNYLAVCITGPGPAGKRRRIFVRKALSTENVESSYGREAQMGIPVTFTGHRVSASVQPFRILESDEV